MNYKYRLYLSSIAWKKTREQIKERCGGICEICNKRKMINAHHLTYEHLYNEPLEDLLGVCKQCHGKIHKRFVSKCWSKTSLIKYRRWNESLIKDLLGEPDIIFAGRYNNLYERKRVREAEQQNKGFFIGKRHQSDRCWRRKHFSEKLCYEMRINENKNNISVNQIITTIR